MPVGGPASYFLRGERPEAEDEVLERALRDLLLFWEETPSLSMHHRPGNIVIDVVVGGVKVTVEITDRAVIDEYMRPGGAGPMAILEELAKHMGLPHDDAMALLSEASGRAIVHSLRVPHEPDAWRPGVGGPLFEGGTEIGKGMSEGTPTLVGELVRQEDLAAHRGSHRARSKKARKLLDMLVQQARKTDTSIAELSRRSGVPASTLRDARQRLERKEKLEEVLGKHETGRRYQRPQRAAILQELKRTKGNAEEVSRRTGVPARTVREIRAREARQAKPEAPPMARADARQELLRAVRAKEGTASEIGRRLGIPERTARDWARKEKYK